MAIREILLLGNPKLYEVSQRLRYEELGELKSIVDDLHDTLMDYRLKTGEGRAIAAPQIGIMKRIIYVNIDNKPIVLINPELTFRNKNKMEVWDNCLSFPGLRVKVERYERCHVEFRGVNWKRYFMELEGDLSELLQHEYDHLNGILAISRALNEKSFAIKPGIESEAAVLQEKI